jgi:hypothetical protein
MRRRMRSKCITPILVEEGADEYHVGASHLEEEEKKEGLRNPVMVVLGTSLHSLCGALDRKNGFVCILSFMFYT